MPNLGKRKVPIVPRCNLGQALLWLQDEVPPMPGNYAAVNEVPRDFSAWSGMDDFEEEFPHLYDRLVRGCLKLYGRPGLGDTRWASDTSGEWFWRFDEHGEHEQIPVDRIVQAPHGFDVRHNALRHVVGCSLDDGETKPAWEYIDLSMVTEELFAEFPASGRGEFDLGLAPPMPAAAPSATATNHVRAADMAATSATSPPPAVDACAVEPAARPYSSPGMDLLAKAIAHFNITDDDQPKAADLRDWFMAQEIGGKPVSRSVASRMATIVRRPELQSGGARRQRRPKKG